MFSGRIRCLNILIFRNMIQNCRMVHSNVGVMLQMKEESLKKNMKTNSYGGN